MGIDWESDLNRVRKFDKEIHRLISQICIVNSTVIQDQLEATDYKSLAYDYGATVRTFKHYSPYKGEFTIRTERPSGTKTELAKSMTGLTDYKFFGFADPSDCYIYYASLIDMKVFRQQNELHFQDIANGGKGFLKIHYLKNVDNSSDFAAYEISSFPPELIKKRWDFSQTLGSQYYCPNCGGG